MDPSSTCDFDKLMAEVDGGNPASLIDLHCDVDCGGAVGGGLYGPGGEPGVGGDGPGGDREGGVGGEGSQQLGRVVLVQHHRAGDLPGQDHHQPGGGAHRPEGLHVT